MSRERPARLARGSGSSSRVAEPDALEVDLAADLAGVDRVRAVDDVGLGVEQVEDLVERRHPLLVGRVELADLLDRVEERLQVADERDQDADLDVARRSPGSRRTAGSPPSRSPRAARPPGSRRRSGRRSAC